MTVVVTAKIPHSTAFQFQLIRLQGSKSQLAGQPDAAACRHRSKEVTLLMKKDTDLQYLEQDSLITDTGSSTVKKRSVIGSRHVKLRSIMAHQKSIQISCCNYKVLASLTLTAWLIRQRGRWDTINFLVIVFVRPVGMTLQQSLSS